MRRLLTLVALCSLAILAACDGDADDTPSPTPTAAVTTTVAVPAPSTPSPTATPDATPPSPPGPRRTGDPALDAIIEAVESHDIDGLLELVELQSIECRIDPDMTWHPECTEGQAEGTVISGIVQSACEGQINPDVRGVLEPFVRQVHGFWAAVSVGESMVYPDGNPDTLLVFHRWVVVGDAPPADLAVFLAVRDGHVIGRGAACVGPLEELLNHSDRVVTAGPWHEPDFSGPRRTGDPALDTIIEIVEARDIDALLAHLRTEDVECLGPGDPGQIGSPPSCEEEGVPVGTQLTVATGGSCEGYYTTNIRGLVERFIEQQDGLYAVVDGSRDVTHLIFHGRAGAASGLELWILEGGIHVVQTGCIFVETRADFLGGPVIAGPWPERVTPYEEGVADLLEPLLAAVTAGDLDLLQKMTSSPIFVRGCGRTPEALDRAFKEAVDGSLYGVYERAPGRWWLVYETVEGGVRMEYRTPQRKVTELAFRCSGTLDEMAIDGVGRALAPIELPEDEAD